MKKIKTVAVVGPTASGKTELGIRLCEQFGGEVIGADSMQIYKGIEIASASPTPEERLRAKHKLIGFLDMSEEFSVADYVALAHKEIKATADAGKLPVIVGGTGLYIDSLIGNITFSEQKTDAELRKKLEQRFDNVGAEQMLKELSLIDEKAASCLNTGDRRRIIRAFEIYETTGKTKTEQEILSRANPSPYDTLFIGITYKDREKLYARIDKRVDLMFENGLVEEARKTFGVSEGKGAAQAIGHKELFPYFRNEISLAEACENLKRATRRYAKRQLTWFRRNEKINWIYADECCDVIKEATELTGRWLNEG